MQNPKKHYSRKLGEDETLMSFRVNKALKGEIEALALKEDRTLSQVIRQGLKLVLQQQPAGAA